jgi:GT2 family glycosyltransferase
MKIPKRLRFGVIILNYKDFNNTWACINSIRSLETQPQQIVLVDNASDQDAKARFTNLYHNDLGIKLFQFKDNLGYAGGNNVGITYLIQQGIEVICLLNNDTILLPGFFDSLLECFQSGPFPDIVSPKILCGDGKTVWSAGERTLYHLLISRTCKGRTDDNRLKIPTNPNCVTGCAMAVRANVFQRVGLLDESYFAYVEDIDFCKRSIDAGFKISVCPQARVIHKVSRTTGHLSPAQLYLKTRNRAYFIKKNISPVFWPISFSWYLFLNVVWALRGIVYKDFRSFHAIKAGMMDWMKGRMGVGRFEEFFRPTTQVD